MRRTFVISLGLMVAAATAMALVPQGDMAAVSPTDPLVIADTGETAPAWQNGSWLNSERPATLASLRGRVVLLNFWVFTCYNCTNTVPALVDFDHRLRDEGLTIIGIHTPEFPPYAGEHDKDNVATALTRYDIRYPVAQDNDNATWDLYGIRYWPSFVLIDRSGHVRYRGYGEFHVGDRNAKIWESRIKELLAEPTPEPLTLRRTSTSAGERIELLAAPGDRINARLTPALELADGGVFRFEGASVTPDGAYFTAPPFLIVPSGVSASRGTIRAGVCRAGEDFCRTITQAI